MFNPQALSKDSPMAHVWLASSMDRKLSKNNYIRTDIVAVVEEIKGEQGSAGSSLRLSGQLLFGVSTIYQRKTLYLKEDCDSALQSLKTFKPGNVDTTSGTSNTAKESTLVLENQITDLNINNLIPDFPGMEFGDDMMPFTQQPSGEMSLDEADESIELGRGGVNEGDEDVAGDDEDLGLDFGDDDDEEGDQSVEVGLERPPARADGEDLGLDGDILPKDFADDNDQMPAPNDDGGMNDVDMDLNMDMDMDLNMDVDVGEPAPAEEPQQEEQPVPTRRKQKRTTASRVTEFDSQSMLPSNQVRQTQEEMQEAIHEFLPDKEGEFELFQLEKRLDIGDLMYLPAGGFQKEIRQLFEPQWAMKLVRAASGDDFQDDELEEPSPKHQRIGEPNDETTNVYEDGDNDMDMNMNMDNEMMGSPGQIEDEDEGNHEEVPEVQELETVEPVLFATSDETEENATNGISKNTLQAARLMRSEMPQPHDATSFDVMSNGANRPDKVKMFFEMLVLATKDAIAVDQEVPFENIAISSKEGLYGTQLMV